MLPTKTTRLSIVQTLRGLAAFIVAWFHFARANTNLNVGPFKITAPDGAYGVTIFFVISGFVLPYSLWKSGYRPADYGRFILKRITRLDPPYFVSIALTLAVGYLATLSPLYRGAPFSVTTSQLLLHVGYLNAFFGKPWINGVYWTLAIEFQYYLILGLMFPVLQSGNRLFFGGFVALCAISQHMFSNPDFLPFHWPLFLMGIVVFRYKASIINASETLAWLAAISCWGVLAWPGAPGIWKAAVAAASALSIMYLAYDNAVTIFFADISYSLYLVHQPIGSRVVNLGARYATNSVSSLFVAAAAMAVSIAFAYALYRCVEKPAQQIASKIQFRGETGRLKCIAPTLSAAD